MLILARSLQRLRRPARALAFTLIELLTVMAVIAILAGLVLSISGYATKKAATSRAEAETKALAVALDSFKADTGAYPHQPLAVSGSLNFLSTEPNKYPSDLLDPRTQGNSQSQNSVYAQASLELYEALTGDLSCSGSGGGQGSTNYIHDMKPDVYGRPFPNVSVSGTNMVTYLSDPFGNCYGYSTANSTSITTGTITTGAYPSAGVAYPGFNSTYDLWSTGGAVAAPYAGTGGANAPGAAGDPMLQWIKNW